MKEKRKNIFKKGYEEQGSILIVGVTFMAFLLFLVVPFLFPLSPENSVTNKYSNYSAALSLAEAGVGRAIWEMNYGDISSWGGDSNLRTIIICDFQILERNVIGDIEIKVEEPDGENPVVKSTGRVTYTDSLAGGKTARVIVERGVRAILERSGYSWICSLPKKQIPTAPVERNIIKVKSGILISETNK